MDITSISDNEVKALAYDELKKAQQAQTNVQACEAELARRASRTPDSQTPSEGEETTPEAPAEGAAE